MTDQTHHINALTRSARRDVVSAIRQASTQTGVDFAYLLEKAETESSLDPTAQAQTSSARGLFQFVDKTWLDVMDKHGAERGYPNVAKAITRDAQGNPVVANAQAREYILSLRDNPRVSALMAAELAQDNRDTLRQSLGREVGNAELYMAHFLGAGGAAKFINEMEANGDIEASYIVPEAARANMAVFYDQGKPLSLDEVFARFEGKFDSAAPQPAVAALETPTPEPIAPTAGITLTTARAAIIAASDPSFAALQALQSGPERGSAASLRADMANQLFTLSLLQAFGNSDDDRSNEWVV